MASYGDYASQATLPCQRCGDSSAGYSRLWRSLADYANISHFWREVTATSSLLYSSDSNGQYYLKAACSTTRNSKRCRIQPQTS
jgi:hypothetical protein